MELFQSSSFLAEEGNPHAKLREGGIFLWRFLVKAFRFIFVATLMSLMTGEHAMAAGPRTLVKSDIGQIMVLEQDGRLMYLKQIHGRTETLGMGKTFDKESIERLEKRVQASKAFGQMIITNDRYLVVQQMALIALAGAMYFFEPFSGSTVASVGTLLSSPYLMLACENYGSRWSDTKSSIRYALQDSRGQKDCHFNVSGPVLLRIADGMDAFLRKF